MRPCLFTTAAISLLAAVPAAAQTAPAAPARTAGTEKISQLIVYGNDPCPQGAADEIVVCARKPEGDRYRIPKTLRGVEIDPKNRAWGDRALALEYAGRGGIGSCSPVGPGGASGCFNQIVREARAERAGKDEVNWNALIETARQERLSKIDAAAAEEEAASKPPK